MSDSFYQPGGQRAAKVGDLFATVAKRYDLINDLQSAGLHRRWKRLLLQMAQIKPGDRALDLCCGTGDISFALQSAGAQVTGLDFSQPMLDVASARAKNLPAAPEFIHGDALHIPFADATFDVVTIGYGLRNLTNWAEGIEEMARVTKPGGRLLILEFGKPDNRLWRAFYFAALKFLVPLFGQFFCRNAAAYAYIFESLQNYPDHWQVTKKLQSLPGQELQFRPLLGGAMTIHFARKAI